MLDTNFFSDMHRAGDLIDERYLLSRPLGVRQGAEMWEAEHQVVGRKVTLKLVALEVSSDVAIRRRLVCEARAAAEIAHTSVVEVYDVGVTPEGVAYLVTEPLRGETLADIVSRNGAMQPDDACQVMLQVLAGLEAAHTANIVHGDLRSDSVILRRGRDGQLVVKLLDFGVSESSLQAMTAPPSSESRSTGRTVDVSADLQAAGSLLFEMLSGKSSSSRAEAAKQSNGGSSPNAQSLVPAIPAALAKIVDQAMSPAVARSIPTAKDLASSLTPFAVSERPPSIAPRDSMMPFLSPEARKSRGMARLEKAVMGTSTRPNLVVIEGASASPSAQYVSRSPIVYEGRAPGPDSIRHINPEELLEPRIPKAPRSPKHLGSNLPRFSRPARIELGPRPTRKSSLPLRKWKASQRPPVVVSERMAPVNSPAPPPLASSSLALQLWSAGLLAAAGLGAGLLLARLLHL
jgi:serine/threonine-protein kinase